MKPKVLFLCTGNSCRSQIAEGWLRHMAGSRYEVLSAGTRPTFLNPIAVEVMNEVGIDISDHRSKSLEELSSQTVDLIITVCDHARETCPVFPAQVRQLHWSFEDPADAEGTRDEVLEVFRHVRDRIRDEILHALSTGSL